MDRTIETRWWIVGTLPDDILTWFHTRAPAQEDRRADHYLISPTLPDTSVKCRAGDRLELKVRTARHDEVPLGHGAGHVEWWTKWSFGLRSDEPAGPLGADWLEVEKRRWVHDQDGCAVELAAVTINGDDGWWSLGLESPADTHGPHDLDRVLSHLFADSPPRPIHLEPPMSRGYAEHLCSMR